MLNIVGLSLLVAQAGVAQLPQDPPHRLKRWLSRGVGVHPELLDHGVVSPFVDVGLPFGYRLGVKVGVLDVLTLGVAAQWRDPTLGLRWAPEIGLALYRGPQLSVGLRYRYVFHPAPPVDPSGASPEASSPDPPADIEPSAEEETSELPGLPAPAFFRLTHYAAGSLVWASGRLAVGLEAGAVYRRELDQSQNLLDPHLFAMHWRPMTGLLLRVGDARWGVMVQAMVPTPEVTLRLEWRPALFAIRKHRDPLSVATHEARRRNARARQTAVSKSGR